MLASTRSQKNLDIYFPIPEIRFLFRWRSSTVKKHLAQEMKAIDAVVGKVMKEG